MNPGRLDQRVTLMREEVRQNELSQDVLEWVAWKTVWAEVVPETGSEVVVVQRLQPEQKYTVTIRYLKGVSTAIRLAWNGRILHVTAVPDAGPRRRYISLQCVERDNDV
ncbi:MAG TPA: phage head closure protein [Bacillota bacterium]|nr:phage head closure protein [Bacillota bacterium]